MAAEHIQCMRNFGYCRKNSLIFSGFLLKKSPPTIIRVGGEQLNQSIVQQEIKDADI